MSEIKPITLVKNNEIYLSSKQINKILPKNALPCHGPEGQDTAVPAGRLKNFAGIALPYSGLKIQQINFNIYNLEAFKTESCLRLKFLTFCFFVIFSEHLPINFVCLFFVFDSFPKLALVREASRDKMVSKGSFDRLNYSVNKII